MFSLSAKIEGFLLQTGEPSSLTKLTRICESSPEEVKEAVVALAARYKEQESGLAILQTQDSVALGTAPELSAFLETNLIEEREKDIGRAGLEVLALVLYRNPISRSEINTIRGVDSSHIIRHLTLRGLIERNADGSDKRQARYVPTIETLAHLGLKSLEELPDCDTVVAALVNYLERSTRGDAQTEAELDQKI
ncbi:MAG: hypothetical protein COV10_02950 [Candidatus Vogelbacteria bacterium CG10_big_fil_rev_8_21_14_0_10_51_16]|uniref:SMC-Scp complex subunit ScpB n=1 Tax=Candidatus Vogelbacteria bacterium CG10_big_fil_rev_8_21_14_0_10_51_16 TaxID=1975045 RepID=A0A2H0REB8_9BACT|nr:MAG: hypothetical protein COV10_02950 [Candidatus Vogelbacteria bacterium CG10_big_fil_rev_8_21_14_0_10_51_16]